MTHMYPLTTMSSQSYIYGLALALLVALISSQIYLSNTSTRGFWWVPDWLDIALNCIISPLFMKVPDNLNGTKVEYQQLALSDTSNDDIVLNTTEEIILRSGFRYQSHAVVSDDQYHTNLLRVVNPLANHYRLKQPPVMILHGGITDTSTYVWASAIQHFPEVWPAKKGHMMRSSNRSLAFMLANRGFDVWLVPTRGMSEMQQRLAGIYRNTVAALKYYNYSINEIIDYELPRQIDKVLEVTGAKKVSLMGFSISTPSTLALVSSNPKYARKVHSYVCMAPLVSAVNTNLLTMMLFAGPGLHLSYETGTKIFTLAMTTDIVRSTLVKWTKSAWWRYILYHKLSTLLLGPSAKYQTFLELPVVGHIMMPTGFKFVQHFCQMQLYGKVQRYDYGARDNMIAYGQKTPPVYNISTLHVKDWIMIQAENDNFSPPDSGNRIAEAVKHPKPCKRIIVPRYNHLDLVAAHTNDVMVNLPIANYLEQFRWRRDSTDVVFECD